MGTTTVVGCYISGQSVLSSSDMFIVKPTALKMTCTVEAGD